MSTDIINQAAFLRTSRDFPEETHALARETNKSYIEIADKVNSRTIGFYTVSRPSITGESWFILNNQRQQAFRQVFNLTVSAGAFVNVNHGIQVITLSQFTPKCYGSYTDGTNSYGLIFGSTTAIGGQISFYINKTQIVFVPDAAAPTPTAGLIVLDWISQP
jgi:hypothetical protein